jgi:hypothetical protein
MSAMREDCNIRGIWWGRSMTGSEQNVTLTNSRPLDHTAFSHVKMGKVLKAVLENDVLNGPVCDKSETNHGVKMT